MGGGTEFDNLPEYQPDGLSPRGRGNLRRRPLRDSTNGSIPAWAGEPPPSTPHVAGLRVYPRVGGGTSAGDPVTPRNGGLSPRGRGNPSIRQLYERRSGSIPAWAGEPISLRRPAPPLILYPRVGGGTDAAGCMPWLFRGLSPRGRGNQSAKELTIDLYRSIPAWAGEPMSLSFQTSDSTVYPRVGGGTRCGRHRPLRLSGLSPRGRGNHTNTNPASLLLRSIPAWAGEP